MRVDVSLVPGEVAAKDVSNAAVVVIDVLRASSTVATALANSCDEVIPAVPHADAVGATQDENEVTWNAALHTG